MQKRPDMKPPSKARISPRKLLLSKWTAVEPRDRERHFMVIRLLEPATPDAAFEQVELEAVLTKRCVILPWRSLTDPGHWLQGWR
jgi:tryptophan-rich hypothetical protein